MHSVETNKKQQDGNLISIPAALSVCEDRKEGPQSLLIPDWLSLPTVFLRNLLQGVRKLQFTVAVRIDITLLTVFPGLVCRGPGRLLNMPVVLGNVSRLPVLTPFDHVFNRIRGNFFFSESHFNDPVAEIQVEISDCCMSRVYRGGLHQKLVDNEHHDQKQREP